MTQFFKIFSLLRLLKLLSFLLFFTQCSTFDIYRITYNPQKNFFEYKVNDFKYIPLRNDSMLLVDSTNFNRFFAQLNAHKYKYYFKERNEDNDYLHPSDFDMATIYSNVQKSLKNKEYGSVFTGINMMRYEYFDIDYYSDILFLEANAYENLGMSDTAKYIYRKFLCSSSKKYSNRFHGKT